MNKGQSLFEVMIALLISAIIIVSLVALVASSIRNTTFSKNKTLTARYAQEATEWLRGERDQDIEGFRSRSVGLTWCLKTLSWGLPGICQGGQEISQTVFKREVFLATSTIGGKTVITADVKVYWEDSQGAHEVRSATNFSDWREK